MPDRAELLAELRELVTRNARDDLACPVPGLLLSRVARSHGSPDYALTEPLLVVMAQGGKRLLLGDRAYEYGAGDCLVVTADVPVTGDYVDITPASPALGVGVVLRPAVIATLALAAPAPAGGPVDGSALATGRAAGDLLDAVVRLVRLVESPGDVSVLAPLLEQEILWRLLNGPHGAAVRQIGLADSRLAHVTRAIGWIRENYAEPMRIDELAARAHLSSSAFHRHFRAVTNMSPLQFQKIIRLQHARTLLAGRGTDIARIGHQVGYDSPSQFSREYRRAFGEPPGRDAHRLRDTSVPSATLL